MTAAIPLLVVSTALGVLAVALTTLPDEISVIRRTRSDPQRTRRLVAVAAIGLVVFVASGWLVPTFAVATAVWFIVGNWQRRERATDGVARTDALASWIENLRDVLVAGDQPVGAINATVATCPAAIRPQVRRLAAGLGRQAPEVVFRRFADDVDDPLGDLVAAGLLIAVQRGARTVAVLTALAEQARQQADRRRLVDAERAPVQREVALLTLIMGALILGVLVFGRSDYLAPYGTAGGQLFLATVIGIYALLLLRVQALARTPRPSRFLTSAGGRTIGVSNPGAVTAVGSDTSATRGSR